MKFAQIFKLLVLTAVITSNEASNFLAETDVLFLLRVRNRPFKDEEVFTLSNRETLKTSSFDPNKNTTFLIHGYFENRNAKHHLRLSK